METNEGSVLGMRVHGWVRDMTFCARRRGPGKRRECGSRRRGHRDRIRASAATSIIPTENSQRSDSVSALGGAPRPVPLPVWTPHNLGPNSLSVGRALQRRGCSSVGYLRWRTWLCVKVSTVPVRGDLPWFVHPGQQVPHAGWAPLRPRLSCFHLRLPGQKRHNQHASGQVSERGSQAQSFAPSLHLAPRSVALRLAPLPFPWYSTRATTTRMRA